MLKQSNDKTFLFILTGNFPSSDPNPPSIILFHSSNFHKKSSNDQNLLVIQLYYLSKPQSLHSILPLIDLQANSVSIRFSIARNNSFRHCLRKEDDSCLFIQSLQECISKCIEIDSIIFIELLVLTHVRFTNEKTNVQEFLLHHLEKMSLARDRAILVFQLIFHSFSKIDR